MANIGRPRRIKRVAPTPAPARREPAPDRREEPRPQRTSPDHDPEPARTQ